MGELRDQWLPRSVKPPGVDEDVRPSIVTFSVGNTDAFGAVLYLLWTLVNGSREVRLVTSKPRLGTLFNK